MAELTFVVGIHHDESINKPTQEQLEDLHYDIMKSIYEKIKTSYDDLKINQVNVYFPKTNGTVSVLINN